MFDIPLRINPLKVSNKRTGVSIKYIKSLIQSLSPEQRMMLAKTSLWCNSEFFRRAIVHICCCKGDSRISPKSCSFGLLIAWIFFRGTVVFRNSYCSEDLFETSNFCKDNISFKNPIAALHSLK